MKELKYRALSNNTWVYGFLSANLSIEPNIYFINTGFSEDPTYVVEKSTIGQFTGLTDKNGKEIYTGDIIEIRTDYYNSQNDEYDHDKTYTGEVILIPSKGMCLKNPKWHCWITGNKGIDKNYKQFSAYKSEVIGNIHQSKELINN